MDDITKAALLLNAVRASHKTFTRLCSGHDPAELWQSESLQRELRLTDRMIERLTDFLSKGWAEREDERTYTFGARFITSKNPDYPAKLLDLPKPPIGLYVKGRASLLLPSVAIVGTRKCSQYAHTVAENLGKSLAQAGVTTVSGGARGIDSAGHRGTLSGNGVTVVIFGNGLDRTYPAENRDMFARILERGAWVSEYPFGTGGETWRFPDRDRLIAAMSSHVVVAESPEGGGAMHTARIAGELGRDLWSIPGRITDDVNKGSNMLIHEGTATLFVGISEFVSAITCGRGQVSMNFEGDRESSQPELTDEQKAVYGLVQRKDGITAEGIMMESGLDFMSLQETLLELETLGIVSGSCGRYSAKV